MSDTVEMTGEIHEAAALFPMLPDDELAELAEDIKANGLVHPIVLDDEGVLIDGRNRLAACRLAGVKPRFETLNGHDPVAYILSSNITRRNLSKGQKAMAVASLLLNSKSSQESGASAVGVSQQRVSQARTVLTHAPELVDAVMSGAIALNDAYIEARQRKDAQQSREEQARRADADLAMLRRSAPDLAELVAEERMTLKEAMAAWRQREEEERERRTRHTKQLWQSLVGVWMGLVADPEAPASYWMPGVRGYQGADPVEHLLTADGLRDLAQLVDSLASAVDARGGRLE